MDLIVEGLKYKQLIDEVGEDDIRVQLFILEHPNDKKGLGLVKRTFFVVRIINGIKPRASNFFGISIIRQSNRPSSGLASGINVSPPYRGVLLTRRTP